MNCIHSAVSVVICWNDYSRAQHAVDGTTRWTSYEVSWIISKAYILYFPVSEETGVLSLKEWVQVEGWVNLLMAYSDVNLFRDKVVIICFISEAAHCCKVTCFLWSDCNSIFHFLESILFPIILTHNVLFTINIHCKMSFSLPCPKWKHYIAYICNCFSF